MPRSRCSESVKAEEMYHSGMALVDIARELGKPEGTVRRWKHNQAWDKSERSEKNKSERSESKRKQGAQPGNKNAAGHGAPKGNKNAEKFGFFSKYLPEETVSIIQDMPTDPLGILWNQIQISYAAIIRAQQIMYVRDRDDKTVEKVEKKDGNVIGEKREVQQAWDKQGNFLSAQAKAMTSLRGDIKQYDELLHKRWDLATDEQKARIEQMKANTERMQRDSDPVEDEGVEIVNDAKERKEAGADIGNHHSKVPADI